MTRITRLFTIKPLWALAIYAFLDLLSVGMGMGVPIVSILLGAPVGWYLAHTLVASSEQTRDLLRRVLSRAAIAAGFTFLVLAVIWGPLTTVLFDPTTDYVNIGIPLILYEPRASFIGWQVLMIVISPFLQFLMMLFGAHVTLALVGPTRVQITDPMSGPAAHTTGAES